MIIIMKLGPWLNIHLWFHSVSITGGSILLLHLFVGEKLRIFNMLQDSSTITSRITNNIAQSSDTQTEPQQQTESQQQTKPEEESTINRHSIL